jgi:hypothetical protein
MSTVDAERRSEWPYVKGGAAAVALLVVVMLVGWGIYSAVDEDMDQFELMVRCLENEKGLGHTEPSGDLVATTADLGALATIVETNPVTIAVSSSEDRAERVAERYRAVGGDLTGRLEVRSTSVYLWERPASPTQRQTLYDCTY